MRSGVIITLFYLLNLGTPFFIFAQQKPQGDYYIRIDNELFKVTNPIAPPSVNLSNTNERKNGLPIYEYISQPNKTTATTPQKEKPTPEPVVKAQNSLLPPEPELVTFKPLYNEKGLTIAYKIVRPDKSTQFTIPKKDPSTGKVSEHTDEYFVSTNKFSEIDKAYKENSNVKYILTITKGPRDKIYDVFNLSPFKEPLAPDEQKTYTKPVSSILPARNNQEVKSATVRIVINKPSKVDVGNMGYGSASIFSCVPFDGGFTAYAFTAAHVIDSNAFFFVDKGGKDNIAVDNIAVGTRLSESKIKIIFQDGGFFERRGPNDSSFRDFAVISFMVNECPSRVIALSSSRASVGSTVAVTGYPMSNFLRTLTQNMSCSVINAGAPCRIAGNVGPGYSGGPITTRDGTLVSIFSGFADGTFLGDSLQSISESMARLCREKKIPYYYIIDEQKNEQKIECVSS